MQHVAACYVNAIDLGVLATYNARCLPQVLSVPIVLVDVPAMCCGSGSGTNFQDNSSSSSGSGASEGGSGED